MNLFFAPLALKFYHKNNPSTTFDLLMKIICAIINLMPEKMFKGTVKAKIIEVRFALSGQAALVTKKKGDKVKKGELLASLVKKTLQAELDRQLLDFEKVRAEFEIFNLQKGEPTDDITKYVKVQKQAELNRSVKEVELAKEKLDMADIFSPIEGLILEDSAIVPGIYLTPSSHPIRIIANDYFFEMKVGQEDITLFFEPKKLVLQIPGLEKTIAGTSTLPILPFAEGTFLIKVDLLDTTELIYGLKGEVKESDVIAFNAIG